MTKRIFNFAAGPCTLPLPALENKCMGTLVESKKILLLLPNCFKLRTFFPFWPKRWVVS
jgi:hypothetical protein